MPRAGTRASATTRSQAAETSSPRTAALVTFVVLGIAVACVYAEAIHAPFIFDDRPAIVDNPSIRRLWPPIGTPTARGPLNPPALAPTARRPLPNLSFAIDYRLGGLDPAGYHRMNLAMHVLAATVLAAIVRRTLRLPYFGMSARVAWGVSSAVALVWALHPLNSEAVVYVTQRTELLVGLCYFTVLWAALRYWDAGAPAARAGWVVVAGLVGLAGMASKEIMVSAPLAVLLYEGTFVRDGLGAARRSWPLYASLGLGWVLLYLLSAGGVGGLADPRHQIALLVWWATQTKMLLLYLKLSVWPWPLSLHYAPAYLRTAGAAWPWILAVAALAAGTLALTWRRPAARFVVLVVVAVLAPTLVVPLPKMIAAERRMYVPLAGLVTLAIVGGYRAAVARVPRAVVGLWVATAAAVVGLGALTVRRVADYATVVGIWQDAVRHQPDDAMSHYNLGVALLDEHRPQEALRCFEDALRLEPDYAMALDNLGGTLDRVGRSAEAIAPLEEALRLDSDDGVAHNNLGSALIKVGRPLDAIDHLNRALALTDAQDSERVHLNLGRALLGAGRAAEAIVHFEQATRLDPEDAEAERLLATALLGAGQPARAVEHYERVVALVPDDEAAHNNLGAALLHLGRAEEAVAHLERAIRLDPVHANAYFNLGTALLDAGRPHEAVAQFQRVIQLDPADAQARLKCAIAYARSDRRADALAEAEGGLAVARARGDDASARELSVWLDAYRAGGDGTP